MADVIGEAQRMYSERLPWWPIGLIRELEERADGLGYEWVERCVRKILPDLETEKKGVLLADIDDLSLYRSRPASLEDFRRKALDIWDRPERDLAQSAVSKLFAIAASRYHSEIAKSFMDMSAPVYLMVEGSTDQDRHLDTCIKEYIALSGCNGAPRASDDL